MPNVPQYTPNQVSSASLPAPRQNIGIASPDVYGAGIAEGASRAHIGIANGMREAKTRKVETLTIDADNQLSKRIDAIKYGDNGVLKRQKENAVGASEDYEKQHKKAVDDIASTLKDPEAQAAFRRVSDRRLASNLSQVSSHQGVEMQRYEISAKEASIVIAREDAARNVANALDSGDPQSVQAALLANNDAVMHISGLRRNIELDINGSSEQETEAKVLDDVSELHASSMQNMLERDQYEAASTYYEQTKNQMNDKARKAFAGKIEAGNLAQKSQDAADVIMRTMNVTRDKAYEQINSIDDPAMRGQVETLVNRRFRQMEEVKNEKEGASTDLFAKSLQSGEDLASLQAKHNEEWVNLPIERQSQIERYSKDLADGKLPKPDSDTYYSLKLAAVQRPDWFTSSKFQPDAYLDLPPKERNELKDMKIRAIAYKESEKAKAADAPPPNGIIGPNAALIDSLTVMNLPTSPSNKGVINVTRKLNQLVVAAGGEKKLTPEALQKLVNQAIRESMVTNKGWFWDTQTLDQNIKE